jgi:hypothetical protein
MPCLHVPRIPGALIGFTERVARDNAPPSTDASSPKTRCSEQPELYIQRIEYQPDGETSKSFSFIHFRQNTQMSITQALSAVGLHDLIAT